MNISRYRVAGLFAAGALAGGILAGTVGASAATTSTTTTPSYGAQTGAPSGSVPAATPDGRGGGHAGETVLTGTQAQKATAAALAAVPGGTVQRVETDSGDATYEAHMTKSDGTQVTVKFDKSLKVTAVEDGMGK